MTPALLAAALLALLLGWASPSVAATLTVTDFGDSGAPGQLRTLIDAAASGDTIVIPAGTIMLTGAAGSRPEAARSSNGDRPLICLTLLDRAFSTV
jgi:hypothetical protein